MFKLNSHLLAGVCIAIATAVSSGVLAQELTFNGDFELGDTTGWTPFVGTQFFGAVTGTPYEGSFSGKIDNQQRAYGAVVKQANMGAFLVEPFDQVRVSFWARADQGIGGVQFAELFSELSGGGTSKAEILGGGPLFPPSATEWTFYSFIRELGDDVSGGVTLQFNAATGDVEGSTSTFEFDNVSVSIFDGLAGDYNNDQVVDTSDYVVWRDNLGGDAAALNGNGSGAATVLDADYDIWKTGFGTSVSGTAALNASASVPEPNSLWLLIGGAVSVGAWLRRASGKK